MALQRVSRLGFVLALSAAGVAAAQAPPTYDSLFQRASAAYGQDAPARCVELFTAAARAAAACAAAGGDRDGAFALLGQAAAKGYRDADRATSNPKLEPLRQDPRWQPFLAGVKARDAARRAKTNAELARTFQPH
jgi:hypothetical protein